ncbi:MAG: hypothetical protein H0T84_06565 [Tatlockia sp.]|nr:hypothetical protein [Tatlockia sp.]
MNLVLRTAVLSNRSNLVKNLCSLDADRAPDQKVVSELLLEGAGDKQRSKVSLEIIKLLCEAGTNPPEQADVNVAVDEVLKCPAIKWDYLKYFCSLKTACKPDQTAIDKIMGAAAKAGDWPFVKALCEAENPPSQKAVGNILKIAGTRKLQIMSRNRPANYELPYEVMTHLFERSLIKPSKEDISATLILICEKQDLKEKKTWDVISYLCALPGEQTPSKVALNLVLRTAVLSNRSNLVKTLSARDGERAPDQKFVADLLIESAEGINKKSYVSLEIIKVFCETSINKPTQPDVSAALEAAFKTKKWDYVSYFCSLTTDNRPNPDTIDNAFKAAAAAREWTVVETLCLTANPPSQKAIGYVVVIAPFEIKKYIFEKSVTKPSQTQVDIILTAICRSKNNWIKSEKLECISYLCALTGEDKPSQPVIKTVLLAAVSNNNQDIVKKLCLLDSDNAPNPGDIDLALEQANRLEMVQYLCELEKYAPGPEAIDKKLIAAASSHFIDQVKYLCESKTPGQQAIDEALIGAVSSLDNYFEVFALEILKYLCESKTIKPSQNAINSALIVSASLPCFLIKYLCELMPTPNQDVLEEAVIAAAPNGSLETFQYLFEKLDSTKQEKVRELASNRTNNIEIKFYLTKKEPENKKQENETVLSLETETKVQGSSNKVADPTRHSSQNVVLTIAPIVEPEPSRNSCFLDSQIEAINARITQLEGEMDGCCFSFFVNTDRKKEKISGLTELLRMGREPGMTVARAITQIIKDERFPELRAGTIYNRTRELIDDLSASSEIVLNLK